MGTCAVLFLFASVSTDVLEIEFLRDAPTAWDAVLEARRLQSVCEYQRTTEGSVVDDYVFKRSGTQYLAHIVPANGQSAVEVVFANNPRYSFAVKRSGEGFVIRAMSDSWDDSEVSAETFGSEENPDAENKVFSMVGSGHMQEEYGLTVFAGGFPLQLIPWDDPDQVSIQSVSESEASGRRLVTVAANFNMKKDPVLAANGQLVRMRHQVNSGQVTFDASRSWVPVSATFQITWASGTDLTEDLSWTYDESPLPLVKTALHRSTRPSGVFETTYSLDYPDTTVDPVEFTLSHYGLPEPPELQQKDNRWTYAIGALVAILVGLVILKRR